MTYQYSQTSYRMDDDSVTPMIRKSQPPLETKSLKAAYLREIVMAARRRGVIRGGYHPTTGISPPKWEYTWEQV